MTAEYIRADRPYSVVAKGPACGENEVILVGIASKLERTRAGAEIGLKVKAGKVEHECDQTRIDIVAADVTAGGDTDAGLPFDEDDDSEGVA